jgi:DNA-binding CsgD family transcriptional regulator
MLHDVADMDNETDRAAIIAVLEAETEAFLRRDFEAMSSHWLHAPQTSRMDASASSSYGAHVDIGWEAVEARMRKWMQHIPEPDSPVRVRRKNMNLTVVGDMAWMTFDQIGDELGDTFKLAGLQHELHIFQRVDGAWKITCIVTIESAAEPRLAPLISVGPDSKVHWLNDAARKQIADHPALLISGERLRARNRKHEAALREAIAWGHAELLSSSSAARPGRVSRAVIIGENGDAAPVFCWVVLENRKVFVTFNDEQMLKRRIGVAQTIYGFSAAQAQLALLIVQGHDLAQAAESIGVSVNTVRTHLQRMFERTGAHSQSALVGLLLSAEAPAMH